MDFLGGNAAEFVDEKHAKTLATALPVSTSRFETLFRQCVCEKGAEKEVYFKSVEHFQIQGEPPNKSSSDGLLVENTYRRTERQ
jgi:hypothetical protein